MGAARTLPAFERPNIVVIMADDKCESTCFEGAKLKDESGEIRRK
jgi:hypothetical protein